MVGRPCPAGKATVTTVTIQRHQLGRTASTHKILPVGRERSLNTAFSERMETPGPGAVLYWWMENYRGGASGKDDFGSTDLTGFLREGIQTWPLRGMVESGRLIRYGRWTDTEDKEHLLNWLCTEFFAKLDSQGSSQMDLTGVQKPDQFGQVRIFV